MASSNAVRGTVFMVRIKPPHEDPVGFLVQDNKGRVGKAITVAIADCPGSENFSDDGEGWVIFAHRIMRPETLADAPPAIREAWKQMKEGNHLVIRAY